MRLAGLPVCSLPYRHRWIATDRSRSLDDLALLLLSVECVRGVCGCYAIGSLQCMRREVHRSQSVFNLLLLVRHRHLIQLEKTQTTRAHLAFGSYSADFQSVRNVNTESGIYSREVIHLYVLSRSVECSMCSIIRAIVRCFALL